MIAVIVKTLVSFMMPQQRKQVGEHIFYRNDGQNSEDWCLEGATQEDITNVAIHLKIVADRRADDAFNPERKISQKRYETFVLASASYGSPGQKGIPEKGEMSATEWLIRFLNLNPKGIRFTKGDPEENFHQMMWPNHVPKLGNLLEGISAKTYFQDYLRNTLHEVELKQGSFHSQVVGMQYVANVGWQGTVKELLEGEFTENFRILGEFFET